MQKIIAANWKMYKTRAQATQYASEFTASLRKKSYDDRLILVFPPFTAIHDLCQHFSDLPGLAVGAQNFYPANEGAFTGEISPNMLHDVGAQWLLVGHSERRHIMGESSDFIARKVSSGLDYGFKIMLCVGETLAERNAGKLVSILDEQLRSAIASLPEHIHKNLPGRFAVAYEPVWAIGTGRVAGSTEVIEAHAQLRQVLECYLGKVAADIPLLYGGSVKPENAPLLLGLDNVDGLLVGGASLEAQSFLQIIEA